jgi:hypothetical protein
MTEAYWEHLLPSVILCYQCTCALFWLQHHPFSTILFACEMQKEQTFTYVPGVTDENGHRIWI